MATNPAETKIFFISCFPCACCDFLWTAIKVLLKQGHIYKDRLFLSNLFYFIFVLKNHALRLVFKAFSNAFNLRVLTTSSGSSHPFRAMPAPGRKNPTCSLRCASGLRTHLT